MCEAHIELLSKFIKPTICNSRKYETNVRSTYKIEMIRDTMDYILKWESNVGKEVFKSLNGDTYYEQSNPDSLNKTETTPTLFTKKLFENTIKHIIEWKIEYYSDDLTNRSITSNSTHKLSNIEFEWMLECKQENIKFHKELLNNFKK